MFLYGALNDEDGLGSVELESGVVLVAHLARIFHKSLVLDEIFWPAAAFSVNKVLSVFSNTPPGLFGLRPCSGPKYLVQNSLQSDRGIIYFVWPRRSYSYDDCVKTL